MEINPAEAAHGPGEEKKEESTPLDSVVGISVVLLATFLGIVSVKSGNIGQKMTKAQADRNDNWSWYQARNLREEMYRTAADEMRAIGGSQPSPELQKMIELYEAKAKDQEAKKETQKGKAEGLDQEYDHLNGMDDQFDMTEASLTVALALMGVTALLKRWWLYAMALVPAGFGLFLGVAGFAGWDVPLESIPLVGEFFKLLT